MDYGGETQFQGEDFNCISALYFLNPLIASAVHIRFLHFILAHYISAFEHIKDKK